MKLVTVLLGFLLSAGAAGDVRAQQTPRPQPGRPAAPAANAPRAARPGMGMAMPRMGGMGMDMGAMMAPPGADRILAMAPALKLTDAQTQQLRTIADQARAAAAPHMQAAMQAHHTAMQALDADAPDVATFEAQLREAANHFVEAQVIRARSGTQALALLTPAQRENVRFALRLEHERMMRGMMGGMGGMGGMQGMGGMNGPGGMQHDTSKGAMPGMMHGAQHPAPGKPATPPDTMKH